MVGVAVTFVVHRHDVHDDGVSRVAAQSAERDSTRREHASVDKKNVDL